MLGNDSKAVRQAVVRAVAKVQRRTLEFYEGTSNIVLSSCDVAAAVPMIEADLGCGPIRPGDFTAAGGSGHAGLCYDPMDDVPIDALCGVVEKAALAGRRS